MPQMARITTPACPAEPSIARSCKAALVPAARIARETPVIKAKPPSRRWRRPNRSRCARIVLGGPFPSVEARRQCLSRKKAAWMRSTIALMSTKSTATSRCRRWRMRGQGGCRDRDPDATASIADSRSSHGRISTTRRRTAMMKAKTMKRWKESRTGIRTSRSPPG